MMLYCVLVCQTSSISFSSSNRRKKKKKAISLHKQLVKYWLEFQYSFVRTQEYYQWLMLGETDGIRTEGAAEFIGSPSQPVG